MPLPFSSPSSPPLSPPPCYLHSLLDDRVSLCPSVERERRRRGWRRVVLINGRKPDDGKGRRETDRPHNLPTNQDTAITFPSLSVYSSLTSVFLSDTHTHTHTQSLALLKYHTYKRASDRKHAAQSSAWVSDIPTRRHTHTQRSIYGFSLRLNADLPACSFRDTGQ